MSLSNQLLLIVSEGGATFTLIRGILEKVTGYENRKVIWSTLERLFQKGLIKKTKTKEGINFSITVSGKKALPEDPGYIPKPDRAWNQKWHLVIFDLPENKRKEKETFLSKLKQTGFAKMQDSTYLSVHNFQDETKKLAKSLGISDYVRVMLVEDLGIEDQRKFAEKVWSLQGLNNRYKDYVKKYQNGYEGQEFSSEVLRFWLKKARHEYLNIRHNDPVFPKELLPTDWMGNEAEKIYQQLEGILGTY